MEAQRGYHQDRFISTVSRRLVCGICHQVLLDPRLCKDEKHSFCFPCISRYLKGSQTCPGCRNHLTPETLVHPQRYFKEILGELVIKCDYIERGCPKHIQLGNLQDHVSHCGFAPVTCEKCGMQINRRDKDNHDKSVCQLGDIKANQDQIKQELCFLKSKLAEIDEVKASLGVIKLNHNLIPAQLDEIMNDHQAYLRDISEKQDGLKRKYDQMDKNLKSINRSLKESKRKRNQEEIVSMGAAQQSAQQSYDVSRFEGEVKEDLLCSICKNVPKDPRLCKNKDHIFCLAHVSRHLQNSQTCPVCRDHLTVETLRRPTGFLKNCLDDLKMKCDNNDRGCPEVFGLESLAKHVTQCEFAPVMCGIGCGMVVNKNEKQNHEKNLCQSRNVKYRDYTQIKSSQDEMKASLNELKASQDEWKQSIDEMKQQFAKMMKMVNQVLQGSNVNSIGVQATDPQVSAQNQDIIIMGGWYAPGQDKISNTVEKFNIAEGKSIRLSPMSKLRSASAACVYNGDVIITGGFDGQDGTDLIEILKIRQPLLEWTMFGGKLPAKLSAYVSIIYQNRLYVIGGKNWNEQKTSDTVYELDLFPPYAPKLLARMPQARKKHGAEIINGKVFILGGKNNKDALDSVVVYDFITKVFKTCPSLPKAVCDMSTVTWGSKIIVVGGQDKKKQVLSDVLMYDTETGTSERLPSMNHKRCGCSAVIIDDVIVVLGGWNKEQRYLNSVESFAMGSDGWKELPGMEEKRSFASAVVIPRI